MKRFIIIDANALAHRAYHALPKLTTKKGEQVSAIYGFLLVFLKAIAKFQPDYVAACFDLPGPTFRHEKFAEYKATRPKTPEELCEQIPKIKEILRAFSVPIFEKQGFEADDIIGTLAKRAAKAQSSKLKTQGKEGLEIIIISGDLDVLQLVDKNTKVDFLKRGVKNTILYDKKAVFERYGFSPTLLPDFKALVGDSSDNIPGVPGIGEKSACKLIKEFGNLENLYREIEEDSEKAKKIKPKIKETMLQLKEQVFFSKMLATIRCDVSLDFNLEKCKWGEYDQEKVIQLLRKFEFYSLINRLLSSSQKTTPRLF